MKVNPNFPPSRLDIPTRQAERKIYDILVQADVPGRALYEAKPLPRAPQLDFAIWVEGLAHFAVQAKGGRYGTERGEWHLDTDRGRIRKPSPVMETWDAAMAVHDLVEERLGRRVFVIPVMAMPDMEPDDSIQEQAARKNVEVLFGLEDWMERLLALAERHKIFVPPTAASIEEEVILVMPELAALPPATADAQVIIHNVEHLHLHVGPEGVDGLEDLGDLVSTG